MDINDCWVGARVTYIPSHCRDEKGGIKKGEAILKQLEHGKVTSIRRKGEPLWEGRDDHFRTVDVIFVHFDHHLGDTSQGCDPEDLVLQSGQVHPGDERAIFDEGNEGLLEEVRERKAAFKRAHAQAVDEVLLGQRCRRTGERLTVKEIPLGEIPEGPCMRGMVLEAEKGPESVPVSEPEAPTTAREEVLQTIAVAIWGRYTSDVGVVAELVWEVLEERKALVIKALEEG